MFQMAKISIRTSDSELSFPNYDKVKEDLQNLEVEIRHIKNETGDLKKDFIAIFGLFASLVTFLSVEVAIFKNITRFSLVMAVSMFFLSALLLFALTLQNIVKDRNSLSDYITPPFVLASIFFMASMLFFAWAAPF